MFYAVTHNLTLTLTIETATPQHFANTHCSCSLGQEVGSHKYNCIRWSSSYPSNDRASNPDCGWHFNNEPVMFVCLGYGIQAKTEGRKQSMLLHSVHNRLLWHSSFWITARGLHPTESSNIWLPWPSITVV